MLSRPPKMTVAMRGFNTSVLTTADKIPFDIAHEFTHYNQQDDEPTTLLGQSIYEGTADFMAEMVDSQHAPKDQWTFGCRHEDALWTQFARQMSTKDDKVIKNWLFTYDPGPLSAPPFIGYWMGSRIVQAYYYNHRRSPQAINDIMHVKDYTAFLSGSGYPQHRPVCAAPHL